MVRAVSAFFYDTNIMVLLPSQSNINCLLMLITITIINYSILNILYRNGANSSGDDFNTSTFHLLSRFYPASTIKHNGITLRDKDVVIR